MQTRDQHVDDADSRGYARLIDTIVRLYRAPRHIADPGASMLRAAADFLADFDVGRLEAGAGRRSPVCRHMSAAIAAAGGGPLRQLADAFMAVEPISDWLQNPNYTANTIGRAFLKSYGYVELVGPGRPVESDAFLIGFLLLGPGTLYPDHSHQAAEVYHVVAGAAEWWREDQDWTTRRPGAAIAHAPGVRHAMRACDEPLLALYCWQGEIATAARISKSDT
jgi:quercetin dioxygenase-like cupin family protein